MVPALSTAMPYGLANWAADAGPPSPTAPPYEARDQAGAAKRQQRRAGGGAADRTHAGDDRNRPYILELARVNRPAGSRRGRHANHPVIRGIRRHRLRRRRNRDRAVRVDGEAYRDSAKVHRAGISESAAENRD